MTIHCSETYVNATEGYRYGDGDVYETFAETPGELYRACVREHGRCTGKVYVDTPAGPRHVGWVFVKRDTYEDSPETYLRETWVTLHEQPDTVIRTPHYADAHR